MSEETKAVEIDPFEGHAPIAGLEHLGRHIRDAHGAPSGSPANFELLRGALDESETALSAEQIAEHEAALVAELATKKAVTES